MPRTKLKQLQYFDKITSTGLTPNGYYLLCCIRDSKSSITLNDHTELRKLWKHEWITMPGNRLTQKSIDLIEDIESSFTGEIKKTPTKDARNEFKDMINKFIEIGPKGKLGSGRPWRSSPANLEKVFKWFFKNYKYKWNTILQATAIYLQEMERGNHKYTQQSHYFVRKNDYSKLADYCENFINDDFHDIKESHDEKIV